MKNFKKVTGIILSICLVITQFYVGEVKQVKAAGGTKTEITSSKLSFEYEKTGEGTVTTFTFIGDEIDVSKGNGIYEIEDTKSYTGDGYQNIGYFKSDVEYILKNVTLTVNGEYEFVLKENAQSVEDTENAGKYKIDCPNIWGPAGGDVISTSKDGKAVLKYNGSLIALYVSENAENPVPDPKEKITEITSSSLSFEYEKTGEGTVTTFTFINDKIDVSKGNGLYEIEDTKSYESNGYQNIGYFKSDVEYTLKNVTLTVNGKYEFVLKENAQSEEDTENAGKYKIDCPNIWGSAEGDVISTSKDGKAVLKYNGSLIALYVLKEGDTEKPGEGDTEKPGEGGTEKPGEGDTEKPGEGDTEKPGEGDTEKPGEGDTEKPGEGDDTNKPGEGDTTKPEKVKTEITSSKLVFTYEKTGETEAKSLKVCDTEVNGFKGNDTYETDIAKASWKTWDETGYYNLGFIESDTAYTLNNVTLIVNGKYEFILNETVAAVEKEGVYKVDFPNIWGGYKEGDVLFTSKDSKATLVSGGNNVVISLYVENTQQKPGEGDTEKPGGGDTEKPGEGDTTKPEMVKTEVTSTKLLFTYEKTGETEAKSLKVCGTEVNGFKGNGTYEIDIAESAWTTWDKTGYYNLGFVESDAAYTLKNITLIANGKYEFILNETMVAENKEGIYKIDFPNMWSGHKEGDILYTSKDKKAALVSGGSTAVISLCIDKSLVPTPKPKPVLSPYEVPSSGTTATAAPTTAPTSNPTTVPTAEPAVPTEKPATLPTTEPVANPTVVPTAMPETIPSDTPEEPTSPSSKPETESNVQKGDKVNVSGQKYEVTNISKNTVAYVAPKNSKKTSVSVPATVKVTVNGKEVTYKVTSIKDRAFKGNKKIKTITLSKNITSIGKDAFKNCGKLKTMVIKSTKITKIGKNAFKGTAKNLVIKVPAKKVSAYKKLFKNKGNKNITVKKI